MAQQTQPHQMIYMTRLPLQYDNHFQSVEDITNASVAKRRWIAIIVV